MSIGPTKERLAELFAKGADSVEFRVARRDGAGVQSYQVVIKRLDPTGMPGVGCMATPSATFDTAFASFFRGASATKAPAVAEKAATKARRKGLLS
jgi:hypothetical protein